MAGECGKGDCCMKPELLHKLMWLVIISGLGVLVSSLFNCITFQQILSGVETAGDISGKANSALTEIKSTVEEETKGE